MTESGWNRCGDPQKMLAFLRGKASDRKLRLFICACCRRVWNVLPEAGRAAVEVAERYADGLAGEQERAAAYEAAGGDWSAIYSQAECAPAKALVTDDLGGYYAADAAGCILAVADEQGRYILPVEPGRRRAEDRAQAHLLRDLFGNPTRPAGIDPVLRTPDVVALAQSASCPPATSTLPGSASWRTPSSTPAAPRTRRSFCTCAARGRT